MQRAVILSEDGNFFHHDGFDWESIEKNAKANFKLGEYKRGGSTITQQLAKNIMGQGSRNIILRIIEKLKEWIIAVKLERNFTKDEILALYLNAVPFGDNVYGIRNAARTFFSKNPIA